MKKLLKLLGIITLTVVIGFVLSCGGRPGGGGGNGNNSSNSGGNGGDGNSGGGGGDSGLGIEMVLIPAGGFFMGRPGDVLVEKQHHVILTKDFYMGKYPVTQGQYFTVTGKTLMDQAYLDDVVGKSKVYYNGEPDSGTIGDDLGMYCVTWVEAVVFCNKLSMLEGYTPAYHLYGETDPDKWVEEHGELPRGVGEPSLGYFSSPYNDIEIVTGSTGYRLPTEAQWEYAHRGDYPNKGTETATNDFYAGGGDENNYGLFFGYSFVPKEWSWDWFDYEEYNGEEIDPQGTSVKKLMRAYRFGTTCSPQREGDALSSPGDGPWEDTVGFRLVLPL